MQEKKTKKKNPTTFNCILNTSTLSQFSISAFNKNKLLFHASYFYVSHLQNLWVVVHLPFVASLSSRGSTLGEVATFVQKEHRFSIFFLQSLQFGSVFSVNSGL